MTVRILIGDVMDHLATQANESVNAAVTSPPYWGLRDYNIPSSVWGGNAACDHDWSEHTEPAANGSGRAMAGKTMNDRSATREPKTSAFCALCNAWRGCLGLEPTPDHYIENLVLVFREIRRILRRDGTLWLNLGDCYAGSGRGGNPTEETSTLQGSQATQQASMVKRSRKTGEIGGTQRDAALTNVGRRATRGGPPSSKSTLRGNGHVGGGPKLKSLAPVAGSQLPAGFHEGARQAGAIGRAWCPPPAGFKEKDLIGMPWRVAMALQADGWWLRQALPWVKRNPMPESALDRPTTAVEYVFQLTKSERYFYDYEALRRVASKSTHRRLSQAVEKQIGSDRANGGTRGDRPMKATRKQDGHGRRHEGFNERYDRKAAEPGSGIKNNTSMDAALAVMPEKRAFRNSDLFYDSLAIPLGAVIDGDGQIIALDVTTQPFKGAHFATFPPRLVHPLVLASCPVGGTVIDPFGGAGTTGLVANQLGRDAILIELNPEYAEMARTRIETDAPLFTEVA